MGIWQTWKERRERSRRARGETKWLLLEEHWHTRSFDTEGFMVWDNGYGERCWVEESSGEHHDFIITHTHTDFNEFDEGRERGVNVVEEIWLPAGAPKPSLVRR